MKVARATAAAVLGLMLVATPADAAWKPTMVPLTTEVQQGAQYNIEYICSGGYDFLSLNSYMGAWVEGFCNPFHVRSVSKKWRKAYKDGERAGWCNRWAAKGGTHHKISKTCIPNIIADQR